VEVALSAWFETSARELPWRGTNDPYAILVSEVMLQQTQAERVIPRYRAWLARWPTVESLAAASPAEAIREWQGLGYNRRALNLWRAARRIVDSHDGRVPSDLAALEALPGVGPYTARAIAAIAFGQPVAAVDTNVRRVIGRIVTGDVGILPPSAVQNVADAAVPGDRPGAWTHAVMDLGATICLPRRPLCEACPAATWCRYADRARTGARTGASEPAASNARLARSERAVREAAPAFPTTSRWLRGRIVDRLRSAGHAEWTVIEGPIGTHDGGAVIVALDALAGEGLVELDRGDITGAGRRARLPID
jgi:A/G-specific adenine glycosylase